MRLPTGTITFLFTDIEGSTKQWEQHPQAMRDAVARHDVLMRQAIAGNDGVVFKTVGDAFCAAFHIAPQALTAALTIQQALQSEPWPGDVILRVRIALHTGTADERDGDYFGTPLNRVARLLSAGHGGQVLLSLPTYELTRDALPTHCSLQDLGAHSLPDLARPEQVYRLCHPQLPSEFPPLKSLNTLPNNLPVQLTSFVGREKEIARVQDLLTKTHLLTLTGSGGCGKTRLSLQAAADVLDHYPDGVWLVELASITDPNLVPQTVANVLGVREQAGKTYTQTLTESLKAKALLLVIDNCEHVLSACAELSDTLLRSCPHVKILASSREGLGIAGELTYRVPSLSLPKAKTSQTAESLSQYESVQLFIERARFHNPDFAVTNSNAPALASICHRLDGIPLGIELAAARIRSLSVEEINARLDNVFRLLTGGSKTALPRQQTLRALIDWSYGLLTESERNLLRCLSVFIGGWTLAAAEAVCVGDDIEDWEVLDLLTSLVDKSLVQTDEAEGQTRYRFLETVRQYARNRLAEGDGGFRVCGKHRDYFLQMAEDAGPKLKGSEQAHWLTVLETEHDNLRQAITFCLEDPDGAEKGLTLGGSLHSFWIIRGHISEGRERLMPLLSRPEAQQHTVARGNALNTAGSLARLQGDYALTRSLYEESLAIKRALADQRGIASILSNLGVAASDQGDFALARSLYEESLANFRALGNRSGIGIVLDNLAQVAFYQGDYVLAQFLSEESLAIKREMEDKHGIAGILNNLGTLVRIQDDYATSGALFQEALEINRELGNRAWQAINLNNLGNNSCNQGDYGSAQSFYRESLAIQRELGDRSGIARSLKDFAVLAAREGSLDQAARLFGSAEALRSFLGMPMEQNEREEYKLHVRMVQEALGDKPFADYWAAGRAMSIEQAVEYALGD